MFVVREYNISLIYLSDSSKMIYKICKEVKLVSNLLANSKAELKIIFDLSEKLLIKLSIFNTYFY